MTDSAGRAVVIGSACRCTIFQTPSSRAMIIVARRLMGVTASCPPTLAWDRSTLTRYASSGVTYLVTVSPSTISPSRNCDAAWSTTAPTCSHPRTKGPNGLPSVTSCRWEYHFFTGSGFPFRSSPCARVNCSMKSSTLSCAVILTASPFCWRRTVRSTAAARTADKDIDDATEHTFRSHRSRYPSWNCASWVNPLPGRKGSRRDDLEALRHLRQLGYPSANSNGRALRGCRGVGAPCWLFRRSKIFHLGTAHLIMHQGLWLKLSAA